jgi:hypothetical protein
MGVQLPLRGAGLILVGHVFGREIAISYMVVLCFKLLRNFHTAFKTLPIYICDHKPHSFLQSSPVLVTSPVITAMLPGVKGYLAVVFIYIL